MGSTIIFVFSSIQFSELALRIHHMIISTCRVDCVARQRCAYRMGILGTVYTNTTEMARNRGNCYGWFMVHCNDNWMCDCSHFNTKMVKEKSLCELMMNL